MQLKLNIIQDIIRLMGLGLKIETVQRLIKDAYGINVKSHGIWKIYHTARAVR